MIIVAQEDEQVRTIIAATLLPLGCELVQVDDGDALLECFHRNGSRTSLLVVEKDLPNRSGIDCLRSIRRDGATTPAVVLADKFDAELVAQLDSNTFLLPKPFQMSHLEEIALDILNIREPANGWG